jgi:hypothetical protein
VERDGAVQDACQHDGTILGEHKRQVGRALELAEVVTICYHFPFLGLRQLNGDSSFRAGLRGSLSISDFDFDLPQ